MAVILVIPILASVIVSITTFIPNCAKQSDAQKPEKDAKSKGSCLKTPAAQGPSTMYRPLSDMGLDMPFHRTEFSMLTWSLGLRDLGFRGLGFRV